MIRITRTIFEEGVNPRSRYIEPWLMLNGDYDKLQPIRVTKKDLGYFFAALLILAGVLLAAFVLLVVMVSASDCGNSCPSLLGAFLSALSNPYIVAVLATSLLLVVVGIYFGVYSQKL